jgi:hypothetical protein
MFFIVSHCTVTIGFEPKVYRISREYVLESGLGQACPRQINVLCPCMKQVDSLYAFLRAKSCSASDIFFLFHICL